MTTKTDFINYIVEFTESSGQIYRSQTRPIVINLAKRKFKKVYVREKAIVLLQYLAETGIKAGKKSFCEYNEVPASAIARIPASVKKAIAVRLLQDIRPEIDDYVRDLRVAASKKKPLRRC
jgi:hypothetical protein